MWEKIHELFGQSNKLRPSILISESASRGDQTEMRLPLWGTTSPALCCEVIERQTTSPIVLYTFTITINACLFYHTLEYSYLEKGTHHIEETNSHHRGGGPPFFPVEPEKDQLEDPDRETTGVSSGKGIAQMLGRGGGGQGELPGGDSEEVGPEDDLG